MLLHFNLRLSKDENGDIGEHHRTVGVLYVVRPTLILL